MVPSQVQGGRAVEVCKSRREREREREREYNDTTMMSSCGRLGAMPEPKTSNSMQMTSLVTSHSVCTASLVSAELV